jgi:hypothetical protein
MTSRTSQQDTKNSAGEFPSEVPSPGRAAGDAAATLAERQEAMLKDLVTAQVTALEAFERLIASTGPASEDLMNQFSRELMLGLFRLYPLGQEIGRHSCSAMTELARECSMALRSALGVVDGEGARLRDEGGKSGTGKASSVSG